VRYNTTNGTKSDDTDKLLTRWPGPADEVARSCRGCVNTGRCESSSGERMTVREGGGVREASNQPVSQDASTQHTFIDSLTDAS
jgi:hypothetical protein